MPVQVRTARRGALHNCPRRAAESAACLPAVHACPHPVQTPPTCDACGAKTLSNAKLCAWASPPLLPAAGCRSSRPRPASSPAEGKPSTGAPGAASAASPAAGGRTRANTRMLPFSSCMCWNREGGWSDERSACWHQSVTWHRERESSHTAQLNACVLLAALGIDALVVASTRAAAEATIAPSPQGGGRSYSGTWMVLCRRLRSASPSTTLRSASASSRSSFFTCPGGQEDSGGSAKLAQARVRPVGEERNVHGFVPRVVLHSCAVQPLRQGWQLTHASQTQSTIITPALARRFRYLMA